MLWSFPIAFFLLVAGLIFLLRRKRDMPVASKTIASVALWRQLASRQGRLLSKLRWWEQPGLLWKFAGLFFLVLAAAGPLRWAPENRESMALIVVVDNCSPGALLEPQKSETLLKTTSRILAGAAPSRRIALIALSPTPRLVHPLSSDSGSLLATLSGLTFSSQRSDFRMVEEALGLADTLQDSMKEDIPSSRIVWMSSSPPPGYPLSSQGGSIDLHSLPLWVRPGSERPGANEIALVGAGVSRRASAPDVLVWHAGFQNQNGSSLDARLLAATAQSKPTSSRLDFSGNETIWRSGEMRVSDAHQGALELEVRSPAMNAPPLKVSLPLPPPPAYEVEIVGSEDARFWDAAFSSLPGWSTKVVETSDWEPGPGPDLRVLIGVSDSAKIRDALGNAPAWLVNCGPFHVEASGSVNGELRQINRHPATKGLDLETIIINQVSPPAGDAWPYGSESTILSSENPGTTTSPLITAGSANRESGGAGYRWIAMGFAPGESNLALRAAFPALINQGTLWLLGRDTFDNEEEASVSQAAESFDEAGQSIIGGGFSTHSWWVPTALFLSVLCFSIGYFRQNEL